jgi:hypothetical protein
MRLNSRSQTNDRILAGKHSRRVNSILNSR